MFNRRYLRIKVFQALYAYWQDREANRAAHSRDLPKSLRRAHELFLFLLAFPAEFRFYVSRDLDIQHSKHIPQGEKVRPLEAIVSNKAIEWLANNVPLNASLKNVKLRWTQVEGLFRELLGKLRESSAMQEYLATESPTFTDDRKLLSELYELFIAESPSFDQYIEDQFISWEDDQVLVAGLILKTIGHLKEELPAEADILSGLEDDGEAEAMEMMNDLFNKTIDFNDELESLIAAKTQNWEADRIAMVDMLLMKMALCEILHFPYIPVKVSINEYLELAKLYSTPQSHGFINGILDKIQLELRSQNRILKQGRGLVE